MEKILYRRLVSSRGNDVAYTSCEGGRIELGAHDLVGAVSKNRYTPVADKGNQLLMLCSFDLGAHVFGTRNSLFTFHIDQYEIVLIPPEHRQACGVVEGGVDVKS